MPLCVAHQTGGGGGGGKACSLNLCSILIGRARSLVSTILTSRLKPLVVRACHCVHRACTKKQPASGGRARSLILNLLLFLS